MPTCMQRLTLTSELCFMMLLKLFYFPQEFHFNFSTFILEYLLQQLRMLSFKLCIFFMLIAKACSILLQFINLGF